MQPIDLIEICTYGTSKVKKEEIECNAIIKRYKND